MQMSEEAQKATIKFLRRPDAYGIDTKVDVITTHISQVFLAGDRVYKLKRAVHLPYVDFSDPKTRKWACEQELALNRRTAPEIYLEVAAITRESDGALRLRGKGEALDWVVVMRRFDQDCLLDALARESGQETKLTRTHMEDLAESLFAFHEACEIVTERGGHAATAAIVAENREMLEMFGAAKFDARKLRALAQTTEAELKRNAPLLDARRDKGRVRHAHGDLHLRNIVLLDVKPTPFDCIEFNDEFAIIDIAYDLAFLLMDLEHRHLRGLANTVLNRTLDLGGDIASLACLPLFLSMRATVRAHVDATQEKLDEGAQYLDLALDFLAAKPVRLVAVGGLSGSGKSSLARLIAPPIGRAPGAVVLRSDATRKRLAGVGLYDSLPESAYTQEISDRVYERLLLDAERALLDGHSVILDAVHARPREREQAANLAHKLEIPFTGLWLDVPLTVRQARIGRRRKDASDATTAVAKAQDSYDLGAMDWHILDASQDIEPLTKQAQRHL
jgi:aminoglycoside phosphotransferase family enzyme/predicted kinase